MKSIKIRIFCLLLVSLIQGCANLTSLNRHTDVMFQVVDGKDKKVTGYDTGRVIHLDAKQRVVIQKPYGIICAEPSPDALSAIATSTSGSLSDPTKGEIALANAISENAGSIGLRTQTIQLMRDALYRVCEAYYSRALGDTEVMMLHQRYQDVMVAVLAIEQLTGTIKADQVSIQGDTSANALARSYDLTRALAENRNKLSALETEKKKLEEELSKKNEKYTKAKAASDSPQSTDLQKEEFKKTEAALKVAKDNLSNKEKEISDLNEYIAVLEKSKKAALSTAELVAKGTVNFGKNVVNNRLSDNAAQHISKSVVEIVDTVVSKDYMLPTCMAIIADSEEIKQKQDDDRLPILEFCHKVFSKNLFLEKK